MDQCVSLPWFILLPVLLNRETASDIMFCITYKYSIREGSRKEYIMKKAFGILLGLCLLAVPVCAAEEDIPEGTVTDGVSSASVMDYFGVALEGDELMDAINSFSGAYVISTVGEDGAPLSGFFVYSCVKDEEGNYYLQLGLAENQTRANLLANGKAYAMYAALPDAEAEEQYCTTGARMELELVTDEELAASLNTSGYDTALFAKITSVRPLG